MITLLDHENYFDPATTTHFNLQISPEHKMTTNTQQDPKPDGAAFDDFFDSIGKKAENLTINGQNGESTPATYGAESTDKLEDDGEPKIVDENESLCMNCRENVYAPKLLQCAHS